jgi:hypothetical protein
MARPWEVAGMNARRRVRWFGCGAASAVAIALDLRAHPGGVVAYCETNAEHPDNARFLADCERWWGVSVIRLASDEYADTWDVWERRRFLSGPTGAPCTGILKVAPRHAFQRVDDVHVFGYTCDATDQARAARLAETFHELTIENPLIVAGLDKAACLAMVQGAGIALPVMYSLGFTNNNCLEGSTEFITDLGVRTLKDAAGESVIVRGVGGGWTGAEIKSFGVQPLMRLSIKRNNITKTIHATAGHRWFIKADTNGTKRKQCTTSDLRPGDRLAMMFGQLGGRVRPSAFGVAQGIVFGDGTRGNTLNTAATLVLCGDKNKELLRFFPLSPTAPNAAGIEVRDLPRFWKDKPRLDESKSFLYGWLSGYFAADGCADGSGSYIISSARRDHLEIARDVAIRLGIGCHDIRSIKRKGFGETESELFSLPLVGATLREDFFVIEEHKKRFLAQASRDPHPWTVVSVEPTDRIEEVFCAVVPHGEMFTLAGNILTGNCIPCVKATSPNYWSAIRQHFPEEFSRMATLSRRLGARLTRIHEVRIFIDEIPADWPTLNPMAPACDFLCQIASQDLAP